MDWQVYLTKARNNLRTAQSAYEEGDFDSCASRAYFAVFHVEIAAGLVKTGDFGRVFLVLTLTAFVPGTFSFPGSAWERNGRAALPLHERTPAGRACQTGRAQAELGHEDKSRSSQSKDEGSGKEGRL